jgi:hypothetical protein
VTGRGSDEWRKSQSGRRTAETAQDACGLVAFLVESGGPEGFRAQLVAQFVYRGTEFVDQSPRLVEADLASAAHARPPAALLARHVEGLGRINLRSAYAVGVRTWPAPA